MPVCAEMSQVTCLAILLYLLKALLKTHRKSSLLMDLPILVPFLFVVLCVSLICVSM